MSTPLLINATLFIWYIRKSLDMQDNERQYRALSKYCADLGIVVPERYRFEETGKRDDVEWRPIFSETIMGIVKQRKNVCLLVETYDRIGMKNDMEFNYFAWQFIKANSKIVSVTEGNLTDIDDETGGIKRWMKASNSRGEGVSRSYRLISNRKARGTSGDWLGGLPPLGYDVGYFTKNLQELCFTIHFLRKGHSQQFGPDGKLLQEFTKDNPKPKDKRYRPRLVLSMDITEQETAREVYETWTSESISLHKLGKRLNRAGKTLRGKPFNHRNLTILLQNPAYCGTLADGKCSLSKFHRRENGSVKVKPVSRGEKKYEMTRYAKEDWHNIIENNHVGLVDPKTWDKAQEKLKKADRDLPAQNPVYWLKGLLWCGNCGGKLTPSKRGGKPCYVCLNHKRRLKKAGQARADVAA